VRSLSQRPSPRSASTRRNRYFWHNLCQAKRVAARQAPPLTLCHFSPCKKSAQFPKSAPNFCMLDTQMICCRNNHATREPAADGPLALRNARQSHLRAQYRPVRKKMFFDERTRMASRAAIVLLRKTANCRGTAASSPFVPSCLRAFVPHWSIALEPPPSRAYDAADQRKRS